MRRAELIDDNLWIDIDRRDFAATVVVKSLTLRRRHDDCWCAPVTLENVEILRRNDFELCPATTAWVDSMWGCFAVDPDFRVPGINGEPLPYQQNGIQIIDNLGGRALLADDPGLGKSMQAIGWCQWRRKRRILIFCPAFAKLNWADEIRYWVGPDESIQIVNGLAEQNIDARWVICNYDILMDRESGVARDDIYQVEFDVVIADECHMLSNPLAIRSRAVKEIAQGIPHFIAISATPGKNRPADLFTAINLVSPKVFPSFMKYGHRYCGPKQDHMGKWEFKGSTNELELYDLLTKTIMIRRKKEAVFPELPPKMRITVMLGDGKERKIKAGGTDFGCFERLKQVAVKKKMPEALAWIWNLLESEDKVVVFAEHQETIAVLMKEFGAIAVKVDGSTAGQDRGDAVYRFQRCARCGAKKEFHGRDPEACEEYQVDLSTRVFIGSRAAKESGTLTASNHVVFLELWWSVKDHEQAEGRCHGRAGDLHAATCWYLLAKGSIEEEIASIISLKDRRMTKALDGVHVSPDMLLSELIRRTK